MVVIGGGITGMEAALFLRAQGNEVSVVDMLPEWPTDMQGGDPRFMMEASLETKHCYENHIGMYYNNRVLDFADGMLNLRVQPMAQRLLCRQISLFSQPV